jgi:hypothetical protein
VVRDGVYGARAYCSNVWRKSLELLVGAAGLRVEEGQVAVPAFEKGQ